jgi:hypothetical protein
MSDVVKTIHTHGPTRLGTELAVLHQARYAGLLVPRGYILDPEGILIAYPPEFVDLKKMLEVNHVTLGPAAYLTDPSFIRTCVFLYGIGDVNVRNAKGDGLLVDDWGVPCYGERHLGNMSWDGKRVMYFDFESAFAHRLWMVERRMSFQGFLEIIPEMSSVCDGFRSAVRTIFDENKKEIREEAVRLGSDVDFGDAEGFFLSGAQAMSMCRVFRSRVLHLAEAFK